ncbi:hypothetical protein MGYG_01884 [Nannizzia gypsea CBS 118893]|uniref:Uncharacterized protein n=1 Tax=Arthroderma gypseum (strain ATCC MYA-4604 / CBS 118893) TaxID=535722 RepID=E5QYK6_ARTGP|nr:hypothetical protein MGYG_01884 [Nannizzia gypsea CBS 118893]EFQ98869.1 hypothetical protein MGYG_01884 [Nannizzia gypsea CBS 118893]
MSNVHHPAGEFKPSRPHDEHLDGPKHKPGVKASPADHVPESHPQPVAVGTAPRGNLYQPKPSAEDIGGNEEGVPASSTLMGATSADVNKGMGKPMQGQTQTEIRHEGEHHRKNPGSGLEGVGANTARTETEMNRLQRE